MCIIAIKEKGKKMPSKEKIETMWINNPDGAGFMYTANDSVYIEKGFMTLDSLQWALQDLEERIDTTETPIVLHFRITTAGGTSPQNTHPFPVTNKLPVLQRIVGKAPLAIAHNGVINIKPAGKDVSDTMEYVMSQLAPLRMLRKDFYMTDSGRELVYNAIRSKMVFLDDKGRIATVGEFIDCDGILYSNYSHEAYSRYNKWDMWDSYLVNSSSTIKGLCWIDKGGYVITPNGEMLDNYDVLVDRQGKVYQYAWEEDLAYPIAGYAKTENGQPYRFDENLVDFIDVAAKPKGKTTKLSVKKKGKKK